MKAILIDVYNQTITVVVIEKPSNPKSARTVLDQWYKLIDCSTVTVAHYLDENDENSDTIMVDDEGLLNLDKDSKFFHYEGAHQPFAGNGLVVGIDDEGDTASCKISVEEVKRKVTFLNLRQVQKLSGIF